MPTTTPAPPVVLAAAAHPDDIEFMMAGTLLLLQAAGAEIHLWNLANGCHGSTGHGPEETRQIRWREAQESARLAGATIHPPLFDDLTIFYDTPSFARVTAVIREIKPTIVLTQPPQDYMEDHQNTCRLIVSASFCRGMPNVATTPPRPAYDAPVALYHALPYGLCDGLRQRIEPHLYVDITTVLAKKRAMLAAHRSQKEWLDATQGLDAYLDEMENMSREVGRWSGRFAYAEGWRQHAHLGLGPPDLDPLRALLATTSPPPARP